ncbi:MAG: sulfite exporter TauE/SafE family protein [Phycisphaerae bacterium]|nr:sulfite exporter TauE/SafE family protein [Phycisphaerae bacterium]
MPPDSLSILAMLFLIVGALYALVGHAGASGYLAVMALMSVEAQVMRPTALAINVLVAAIAFVQFARAGHFSWRLFWPFAAASVPAAFVGGRIHLPSESLTVAIGVVLLLAAARMAWVALRPHVSKPKPAPPPILTALTVGGGLGMIAGLTGTGGGIFLSPMMLLFNWAGTKQTAATASLFILLNSVAGLVGLATAGWTPTPSLALLAAAACIGGFVGSSIGSRRATPSALNLALAAVLLIAGLKLLIH